MSESKPPAGNCRGFFCKAGSILNGQRISRLRSHDLTNRRSDRKTVPLLPRSGLARRVLGWSQTELGLRIGLTQRAIHKLEQGETEPRRTTISALEEVWRERKIEFEDLADGGFRVSIRSTAFKPESKSRRTRS